jgi:hypothetical protein
MDFCVLCRYSGGSNACVNEVNQYILQNISVLDINEIAQQASETLSSVLEHPCTPEHIKRHIHEHTHEPKIVVNLLLRDLRNVLSDVRSSSRVVDADGNVSIDKNNMLVYLKTVEVAASLAMRLH